MQKSVMQKPDMQKSLLACVAIIVLTTLVFGQVYSHDFISYDDAELVPLNPVMQHGLTGEGIREAFKPYYANWIPVTTLTYLVDHNFYEFEPGGYHVTNLIFHTLSSLLVFIVFRYMTGQFWSSLGLALLFALHPSRVEAVAWISERKGLVSTTFMMAAIGSYAVYTRSSRKVVPYLLTAVLLLLSLMAKSMAVTLPCVFMLLDIWPLRRHGDCAQFSKEHRVRMGKLFLEKLPFFGLVIGVAVMTSLSQDDGGSVATLSEVTPWMRVTNVFYGYGAYLVHAVWPVDLVLFYPHLGDGLPLWKPALGLVAVVVLSVAVTVQLKHRPYLFVGWFWFVGMLVPVIGIVQVGAQAYADRYLYVPLLGLGIMVTGLLAELVERSPEMRKGVAVSCVVMLGCFSWVSWMTTSYWKDDVRLFSYVVEVDDTNVVGHTILGTAWLKRDEYYASRLHLERALELDSNHPPALYALGTLYLRENDPSSTAVDADAMAAESATYDQLENNIGASYIMREEFERALPHLRKALKLNPRNAIAMTNLAIVRYSQGNRDKALELARKAAKLDTTYEKAQQFAEYVEAN